MKTKRSSITNNSIPNMPWDFKYPHKNMRPIHIREIKKDEIFYESCSGKYHKFRALNDTVYDEIKKQWTVNGYWIKENEEIRFLVTDDFEHYGPKLWKL